MLSRQRLKTIKDRSLALKWLSNDKTLDSKLFNLAGSQVARTWAAELAWKARKRKALPEHLAGYGRSIDELGCVAIENFFSAEAFETLCARAQNLRETQPETCTTHDHGAVRVSHFPIDLLQDAFDLKVFLFDYRVRSLFAHAEGAALGPRDIESYVEHVEAHRDGHDRENDFHIDTYFNTFKAWIYLNDVNEGGGPLELYPKTHRLSPKRALATYRESIGANMGSRRLATGELDNETPRSFQCKANTFVLANVHAFHRRGLMHKGHQRHAIKWTLRRNPFLSSLIPGGV